jgi:hypothetical protein
LGLGLGLGLVEDLADCRPQLGEQLGGGAARLDARLAWRRRRRRRRRGRAVCLRPSVAGCQSRVDGRRSRRAVGRRKLGRRLAHERPVRDARRTTARLELPGVRRAAWGRGAADQARLSSPALLDSAALSSVGHADVRVPTACARDGGQPMETVGFDGRCARSTRRSIRFARSRVGRCVVVGLRCLARDGCAHAASPSASLVLRVRQAAAHPSLSARRAALLEPTSAGRTAQDL